MISAHNSDIGRSFYNDRVKEVMDAGIMAEPFTYVPITAGHMELVGGNALVFGKIKEGYDVIDINIVPEVTYEDRGSVVPSVVLAVDQKQIYNSFGFDFGANCHEWEDVTMVLAITLPAVVYEGSTYFVNAESTDVIEPSPSASYVALAGDTMADIKTNLSTAMGIAGIEVVAGSPANQIYIYQREQRFCIEPVFEVRKISVYDGWIVNAYISSYGFTSKVPALKVGATHGFAIVYKDEAGRICSVIKSDDLDINIPFYTEEGGPIPEETAKITFKIYHKPPSWAESFEIVYFGNISMDYYLQMRIGNITDLTASGLSNHFSANIQETIDYTREKNTRWKLADYTWVEGDRIRFIGAIDDGGGGTGDLTPFTETHDYEIEDVGTQYADTSIGGDWLIFQATDPPAPFAGTSNIVAEVYRPRKGLGTTVPYGTGMVFEIGTDANGRKYHKGNVEQVLDANGVVTTPAEVINTAHDSYKFIRLNYDHEENVIHPFWAESIFPSDWWDNQIISNKLTSQGFPFLDDLSQRQTELHERFRFGGALIAGTRTNNIAHFTYNNFRDLQKKNGDITGMREIGFTLKMIQMYKETSVYINRVQTFNPDGTSQFTLTDTFIGDMRPMDTAYGCQHPDSIMVNGRHLYYWDNSEGVLIRSAPNGQEVLDTKMKRYYKDIVRWIQTSGGKELLSVNIGANNEFEEIWITFRMKDEVRGLIYSERDGRYKSRIDLNTENFVHLGNFFAHLYRQTLWILNIDEGQDYLSWSGTPTYAEIEVVTNAESHANKVLNACAMVTDHQWTSESKSVVIPEEGSACEEIMESNIPLWERKEGIYFGRIMKDENSKGNFASVLARKMNGREMRGRYAFLKFKIETHDEKVRLSSITVFSTPSERNI